MSHSKDKDFNETGKWQEAILFIYLFIYVKSGYVCCKANRQFQSQAVFMHWDVSDHMNSYWSWPQLC